MEIYISNLLLFLDDNKVASNVDDTTPYAMKENTLQLLEQIEEEAVYVFS